MCCDRYPTLFLFRIHIYFCILILMYISVIPLARSLHPRPYTYFVAPIWEEQVVPWGIVEIAIGVYTEKWIIASIEETPPSDIPLDSIRPIIAVISGVSVLAPYVLTMIVTIAERYALPIHKALSLFFSVPLQSRLDKRNYLLEWCIIKKERQQNPKQEILNFVDTIMSPSDIGEFLEEGTVIIFPDDIFLSSFESAIEKNIEKKKKENPSLSSIILYAEATPTRRSQSWIDIYEGKYRIIVWTRRLLYYNLSGYKKIIYIEDAFGMEYYQYPTRIKNLDILRYIADSHHFDITVISSSPTLSLLANFRDFSITPIRK